MKFNQRLRVRPASDGDGVEFILSEFTDAAEDENGQMIPRASIMMLSAPTTVHISVQLRESDFSPNPLVIIPGIPIKPLSEVVAWTWAEMIAWQQREMGHYTGKKSTMSNRLKQAIDVGMVGINDTLKEAYIYAPPNPQTLTDDDWLNLIAAGTEVGNELRELGYRVHNG